MRAEPPGRDAPGRETTERSAPFPGARRLSAPVQRIVVRLAEIACPPEVRAERRAERVLGEFELMMGALRPAARRALTAAVLALDQGARLHRRSRGRRFVRLEDQAAGAYLRAVLTRGDGLADVARRLKGLIVLCYYELPEVREEVGYRPDPYVAAVSRRRLRSYGAEIRAGEAAVLATGETEPGHREER
jgi:hypothetical protein